MDTTNLAYMTLQIKGIVNTIAELLPNINTELTEFESFVHNHIPILLDYGNKASLLLKDMLELINGLKETDTTAVLQIVAEIHGISNKLTENAIEIEKLLKEAEGARATVLLKIAESHSGMEARFVELTNAIGLLEEKLKVANDLTISQVKNIDDSVRMINGVVTSEVEKVIHKLDDQDRTNKSLHESIVTRIIDNSSILNANMMTSVTRLGDKAGSRHSELLFLLNEVLTAVRSIDILPEQEILKLIKREIVTYDLDTSNKFSRVHKLIEDHAIIENIDIDRIEHLKEYGTNCLVKLSKVIGSENVTTMFSYFKLALYGLLIEDETIRIEIEKNLKDGKYDFAIVFKPDITETSGVIVKYRDRQFRFPCDLYILETDKMSRVQLFDYTTSPISYTSSTLIMSITEFQKNFVFFVTMDAHIKLAGSFNDFFGFLISYIYVVLIDEVYDSNSSDSIDVTKLAVSAVQSGNLTYTIPIKAKAAINVRYIGAARLTFGDSWVNDYIRDVLVRSDPMQVLEAVRQNFSLITAHNDVSPDEIIISQLRRIKNHVEVLVNNDNMSDTLDENLYVGLECLFDLNKMHRLQNWNDPDYPDFPILEFIYREHDDPNGNIVTKAIYLKSANDWEWLDPVLIFSNERFSKTEVEVHLLLNAFACSEDITFDINLAHFNERVLPYNSAYPSGFVNSCTFENGDMPIARDVTFLVNTYQTKTNNYTSGSLVNACAANVHFRCVPNKPKKKNYFLRYCKIRGSPNRLFLGSEAFTIKSRDGSHSISKRDTTHFPPLFVFAQSFLPIAHTLFHVEFLRDHMSYHWRIYDQTEDVIYDNFNDYTMTFGHSQDVMHQVILTPPGFTSYISYDKYDVLHYVSMKLFLVSEALQTRVNFDNIRGVFKDIESVVDGLVTSVNSLFTAYENLVAYLREQEELQRKQVESSKSWWMIALQIVSGIALIASSIIMPFNAPIGIALIVGGTIVQSSLSFINGDYIGGAVQLFALVGGIGSGMYVQAKANKAAYPVAKIESARVIKSPIPNGVPISVFKNDGLFIETKKLSMLGSVAEKVGARMMVKNTRLYRMLLKMDSAPVHARVKSISTIIKDGKVYRHTNVTGVTDGAPFVSSGMRPGVYELLEVYDVKQQSYVNGWNSKNVPATGKFDNLPQKIRGIISEGTPTTKSYNDIKAFWSKYSPTERANYLNEFQNNIRQWEEGYVVNSHTHVPISFDPELVSNVFSVYSKHYSMYRLTGFLHKNGANNCQTYANNVRNFLAKGKLTSAQLNDTMFINDLITGVSQSHEFQTIYGPGLKKPT